MTILDVEQCYAFFPYLSEMRKSLTMVRWALAVLSHAFRLE